MPDMSDRCSTESRSTRCPILPLFCYEMQTATVPHGATLTLYTDGLTEALNEQNQLFGRKRVVQLLTGCANKTPKEVVDTIITEVKQYAGNMEQSDDLTLLVIRRS